MAAALNKPAGERSAGKSRYFEEWKGQGWLPQWFDCAAAASLLQDLSAAMIVQARGSAAGDAPEKVGRQYGASAE